MGEGVGEGGQGSGRGRWVRCLGVWVKVGVSQVFICFILCVCFYFIFFPTCLLFALSSF